MERSLELVIHDHLAAYLAGRSQLDEFKSWLVAATWSLDHTHPTAGIELAKKIKIALAEHSSGFSTDDELLDNLASLLPESLALL